MKNNKVIPGLPAKIQIVTRAFFALTGVFAVAIMLTIGNRLGLIDSFWTTAISWVYGPTIGYFSYIPANAYLRKRLKTIEARRKDVNHDEHS